ncbi:MAG: DUF3253 domain-containing protein [Spirochaetaceae bacterium]
MKPKRICEHCGRGYENRGKPDQKFCSRSCRAAHSADIHRELEERIMVMLASRPAGSTICPSEVARERFGAAFRQHMESVRRAARRLAHNGTVIITQKGKEVDPSDFRGPIRIGRRAKAGP